jgi:glycosyltransferase involved in cell wall biosynthesis
LPRDPRTLKVCFLAGTLGIGGAERQLIYMLRSLKMIGVSTRVLCLTKGEPFESAIEALGVSIEWIGKSPLRPIRLNQLVRALRQQHTDILQSVHFYTNLYVAVASRIMGIPELGAIRNDLLSELKGNGLWGRRQLQFPRHLIANSKLARDRAIALGLSADRVDFVRNAVDTTWLQPNGRFAKAKRINILFVGRLVEEKRPDLFLKVAAKAIHRCPGQSIKITIAGDGPMRAYLESLAVELLLGEQIEFVGDKADMACVYRQADLLVVTSRYEGTPNVLLEAMASSLPVIATRVGGIPELLVNDRGILTEPDDEDGVLTAIIALVNDSNLRRELGRRGREYVTQVHSIRGLGEQLVRIYQKIVSQ